jgi:hypothetical protein
MNFGTNAKIFLLTTKLFSGWKVLVGSLQQPLDSSNKLDFNVTTGWAYILELFTAGINTAWQPATQHNDIQSNDTQHNQIQHKRIITNIQHNDTQYIDTLPLCRMSLCWVSWFIYWNAECRYAECHNPECRGTISDLV